jgi:glycosyltransferase involved in cell wall biosynthesis
MKILLAAASFSAQISGIQRHALNVARSLLTRREVTAVHLVVAPWQRDLVRHSGLEPHPQLSVHVAQMKPGTLNRNRWYYSQLPTMAVNMGVDVVHLAYPAPVNADAFACPTVVTLHDLYPYEIPSNFGFPKVLFNRFILQQCLRNVDAIACVSEITRLRLGHYVPKRLLSKTLRIYNCVEAEPRFAAQSPIPNWKGEPFFLCVAQHRRNKNIPFLLRVFDYLMRRGLVNSATRLVIVGISGPETQTIRRTISRAGLDRNVVLMEGLSELELQWCYRCSTAVLAPSRIEGFGLPVVEALLAGCRVICSDIPAFRELGGDYCHYVPLDEHAELPFAKAIIAAMREPPMEPVSLPMLSTSVIAEQYVRLYRKLLSSVEAARALSFSASVHTSVSERQSL